jgi:hypothetical protein
MNNEIRPPVNLTPSNNQNEFKLDATIRFIKMLDIGYVTVIYFLAAILVGKLLNYIFGIYDPEADANKSSYKIGLELCLLIWLMGISTYIVRNIVGEIPSPFDNLYGFQHRRVKELGSATVYVLILNQSFSLFRGKLLTFLNRTF